MATITWIQNINNDGGNGLAYIVADNAVPGLIKLQKEVAAMKIMLGKILEKLDADEICRELESALVCKHNFIAYANPDTPQYHWWCEKCDLLS